MWLIGGLTFTQVWWLVAMALFFVKVPNPGEYVRRSRSLVALWCFGTGVLIAAFVRYLLTGPPETSIWSDIPTLRDRIGTPLVVCLWGGVFLFVYFMANGGLLMTRTFPALLGKAGSEAEAVAARLAARYVVPRWMFLVWLGMVATWALCYAVYVHGAATATEYEDGLMAALIYKHDERQLALCLHTGLDANLEMKHYGGGTGLHLAAKADDPVATKLLLEAGADVNRRDDQGKTALDYAIEGHYDDVAEVLRKYGATQ